jgi:acyl-coenzyme A synthetase/AMP-(fatty) acid ligase
MARSYLGDEEASAKAFRDGWYYPGDTGKLIDGVYLVLSGRVDDRINVQGAKIDPAQIENVLTQCPGVRDAGVVGIQNHLGLTMVIAAVVIDDSLTAADLTRYGVDRLRGAFMPAKYVKVQSMPRTPLGKLDRRQLKAGLEGLLREAGSTGAAPAGP